MGARPKWRAACALALALASFGACRDAPEVFEPPELEPLGPAPYQLTFDPGREVSPAWSADGEEVIYISERTILNRAAVPLAGPQPPDSVIVLDTIRTSGIVRAIAREGGTARQLLPVLQPQTTSVPIDFAVQGATEQVATLTFLPVLTRDLCGGVSPCSTDLEAASPPRLTGAVIRLREPGSEAPPETDTRLNVTFEGRTFDTSQNPGGIDGVWVVDKHPFQQLFNATGRAPNRLSWSPCTYGTRLPAP